MKLPQPTPQFWFAKAALGAQMQAAATALGFENVATLLKMQAYGGAAIPQDLDGMVRAADAYPGAVMAVQGFGQNAGTTVKMRRNLFTGGGYDLASRQVRPDKPTSLVGQSIQMEEVPVVLQQYEGPFSSVNGVVQPYNILQFDAKYAANVGNLAGEVALNLLYDYIKWLDSVIRNQFRASTNIVYADGVSNVTAMTVGAGHAVSLDLILAGRKVLSDNERKPFPNGKYICLMPTQFNVDMPNDQAYRQLAAMHQAPQNPLFGFMNSIQDVDIFECTTLYNYLSGATVPTDGNAVPTGSEVFEGLIFGPDAVGFGQAAGPQVFSTSDTDYEKNAKVIWRSTEAFQTLDQRGIVRLLFQAAS